jgi:UDP-N-acetylglucosamine:LPS N-acetylglucosamine transferase
MVRGLPSTQKIEPLPGALENIQFLGPNELSEVIAASGLVICRSGYSSLMDLKHLGKKAILIPTPGQPEQEYLAHRLREDPQFEVYPQDQLDLSTAIEKLENRLIPTDEDQDDHREDYLGRVLEDFLSF